MKKTTIFAFLLLLNFAFFSCSTVEEETPDLSSDKELVKVSLGSLKINQSDPINGRTAAVPSTVEYIDVVYGPYPDFVSSNPGDITERVIETFPIDEFPENYTLELERGREYYVAMAASSLTAPRFGSIYEAFYRVSGTQPIIFIPDLNGILKNDFYSSSQIFTAENNMSIDLVLNRINAQFRIQMPEGVDLPSNAVKGEVSIKDECPDDFGAIDLELIWNWDICDVFTWRYTADLTTSAGLDTVFYIMPMTDSGYDIRRPLEIAVKLFDASDAIIAEGTAQMDTIHRNTLYNFVLDPGTVNQAISIDVDETLGEEVDVIFE